MHIYPCVCVCVQQYEEMGVGGGSCSVQSQVHVLKCSPRDGQYYPCPLHQQGTGGLGLARGPLSPNRWKWAEERWRIGEEEENGQRKEKGREGGSESQSVLIKCCIEDDIPPTMRQQQQRMVPPLIQAHARTICTAVLSQGVRACIKGGDARPNLDALNKM